MRAAPVCRPVHGFDHATEIDVRFRDLDPMAHVNNAVYVSYLEEGRERYFEDVLETTLVDAEIVLAELSIEYEAPIRLGESVTVHTRVPALGESSFPMENAIETDDGLAATAEMTIVPFDAETERSRAIPAAWRERVRRHEGFEE